MLKTVAKAFEFATDLMSKVITPAVTTAVPSTMLVSRVVAAVILNRPVMKSKLLEVDCMF